MSDPMKIAVALAAWFALMIPLFVLELRKAPRQVDKELAKMVTPPGIRLDQAGDEWLRGQLICRQRWSITATDLVMLLAAIAFLLTLDSRLSSEVFPYVQFPIALLFGRSLGATLASTRQAAAGTHRMATLRPRALGTYTRQWERIVLRAHLGVASLCGIATVLVTITGRVSSRTALVPIVLTFGWLGALALVRSCERRIMRTPPAIADEEGELARELLVSIAVRDLLRLELLAFAVVVIGTLFYLPTLIPGFEPMLAALPLYAFAGGLALARHIRRDRGRPDLEWQFATTSRSYA